jgi:hypothetical protein
MLDSDIYCDLKPTGGFFFKKALYKCDTCGLTLALENPDIKITCFKKTENLNSLMHTLHHGTPLNVQHHGGDASGLNNIILDNLKQDSLNNEKKKQKYESKENLCSTEEIDERLKICNTCEHFKNNSCLLCGCTVVRDANHKNKLAHRNQSCPVNKWGPISS